MNADWSTISQCGWGLCWGWDGDVTSNIPMYYQQVCGVLSGEQQQAMGVEKGIVMDGRDIGTTVFPQAELKIFVTASAQVRAQRRYDELKAKGMEADFDEILHNVEERDYIDSHRETSPLRQADDALVLDNSQMTIAEQNEWLMKKYEEAAHR